MMSHTVVDDFDRFGFTRHDLLSTSTAAAAPLALVSAPQATFEVTTLDDVVDASDGVLSLREAMLIANATPGRDAITFAPALLGGRISLATDLPTITDDLAINGDVLNRGSGGIILAGDVGYAGPDYSGALTVLRSTGAEVLVTDLTITRGLTGIRAYDSGLTLERVAIDDFVGGGGEGANDASAIIARDSIITIRDSSITRLQGGSESGPGIGFVNSDVSISNTSISENFGNFFSGIAGAGGNLLISNSTINNNIAFNGYGIKLNSVNLFIQNSTLANNGNYNDSYELRERGGALSLSGYGDMNSSAFIFNTTITGNSSAIQAASGSSFYQKQYYRRSSRYYFS
jgi:hypothetical protein